MFQLANRSCSIGVRLLAIALGCVLLMSKAWSQTEEQKLAFQLLRTTKLPLESAEILALGNGIGGKHLQFVTSDKMVHFYTNEDHLSKSKHFPFSIHAVAAGNFVGVYYLDPQDDGQKLSWEVFHFNGDRAYHLQWTIGHDQLIPRLFLSARGTTVIFFPEECLVKFFDSSGYEIRSTVCFENAAFTYERNVAGAFSDDGQWFALATMENAAVPDTPEKIGKSGSPVLILFDQQGQEQWRVALPGYWSSNVAISGHGDYIAVCSYSFDETDGLTEPVTMIFDREGKEIFSLEFLFRTACFSPQSSFLLLADRTRVSLVELQNRELLWQKTFDAVKGLLVNAAIAHNAEAIALLFADGKYVQGKFLYETPQLLWVDRDGTSFDVQQLSGGPFQNSVLEFSADGVEAFVATGSEFFKLAKSQ